MTRLFLFIQFVYLLSGVTAQAQDCKKQLQITSAGTAQCEGGRVNVPGFSGYSAMGDIGGVCGKSDSYKYSIRLPFENSCFKFRIEANEDVIANHLSSSVLNDLLNSIRLQPEKKSDWNNFDHNTPWLYAQFEQACLYYVLHLVDPENVNETILFSERKMGEPCSKPKNMSAAVSDVKTPNLYIKFEGAIVTSFTLDEYGKPTQKVADPKFDGWSEGFGQVWNGDCNHIEMSKEISDTFGSIDDIIWKQRLSTLYATYIRRKKPLMKNGQRTEYSKLDHVVRARDYLSELGLKCHAAGISI